MKINLTNQSFGKLRIATPEQRLKITKELDAESQRYLFKSIQYDSFQAMEITKNGDVYIYDLSFDKPKKIEDKNLDFISKVRKGIDILRSEKNPDYKSSSPYYIGEVASPGYCCGYGGYGCSW